MPQDRTMELFAALLRSSMGDQLTPGTVSFTEMLADDAPKLVHHMVHVVKRVEYERVELKPRGQVIDVKATDGDAKDKGSTSG